MKLLCPSCNGKINIGGASRFDLFNCPHCKRIFRGTKADYAAVEFFFKKYFTWKMEGYDSAYQTPCPHCASSISLVQNEQFKGVIAPDACWSCGRDLPNTVVKEFAK